MAAVFTCSIDDGSPSDLKFADLLDKHDLKGTFYVPITNREGFDVIPEATIKKISQSFEIGSHTYDHCYLVDVNSVEARRQIVEGKDKLENFIGKEVPGFCYPGGKYSKKHVTMVADAGFQYARTTMNFRFDTGTNRFEMPTTCQFYPHAKNVYLRNFIKSGAWSKRKAGLRISLQCNDWIERIYRCFEHASNKGDVFHLWAHSREIDALDAWGELDRFFAHVATKVAVKDRLSNAGLAARSFGMIS